MFSNADAAAGAAHSLLRRVKIVVAARQLGYHIPLVGQPLTQTPPNLRNEGSPAMPHSKSQLQLAEATVDMMRACALATTRAASAPVFQGMSFWSWMLRTSTARPAPVFPPIEGWAAWSRVGMPAPSAQAEQTPAPAESSADPAVSSYRSSSGHAVAQVIVG
jgi:hypothetical protein